VKSKFETRWAGLAFTTEKMIRGKRTSPETGVGSFKGSGIGLSRLRGGGTGLVFGPTRSLPSGGEGPSSVVGRKSVSGGLLVTTGGSGSRLVLLSKIGVFVADDGFGFAVKGTSLSDSASSSEINRTGGNLASPSFGEIFRTKSRERNGIYTYQLQFYGQQLEQKLYLQDIDRNPVD